MKKENRHDLKNSENRSVLRTCLGGATVAVTAVTTNNLTDHFVKAADATRRIYAIDNTNTYWFVDQKLYLHEFTNRTDIEMTQVISDFLGGIWYADIPVAVTGLLFRNQIADWDNAYQKTADYKSVNTLGNQVFYIGQNSNGGACPLTTGTISGMSGAQIGEVLSYYDSCNASTVDGYGAYSYVNDVFYAQGATGKDSGIVPATHKNTVEVTVSDKMAFLSSKYNTL